jgi:hypothetical protein
MLYACRFGRHASRWMPIEQAWTLHDLLSRPDYVIPGVPLVAAVARGSQFRDRFLTHLDAD